jgi:1,4-dihydroxy-2-naphthoate octaprenyltransferase
MHRWILAARPPTLWAAVAPVLVGAATAAADDVFDWPAFLATTAAALAIQVGVNFANDVADASTGADTETRIGPQRAVASGLITPREMWWGIGAAFGTAALIGLYLISRGGPLVLIIGVVSVIAALGYTNGPVPYGYRGLGELFVFVFFGLVATVGTRWVFDRTAPSAVWIGGVVMGLLATAILVANNVRDIDTDREAGKRTLAVMAGRTFGRWLYAFTTVGAVAIAVIAAIAGVSPALALVVLIAVLPALSLTRTIFTEISGPPLIGVLKGTARLQLAVATLLAIGIVIG